MMSWLSVAGACCDTEEHRDNDNLEKLRRQDMHDSRLEQRNALMAIPGAEELLRNERDREAGEDDEPVPIA